MDNLRFLTEIKRCKDGKFEMLSDLVVREVSFTIKVNGERLVAIACLPENLPELALGFLFSEGIILQKSEVLSSEFSYAEKQIDFELDIPKERITSFQQTGEKTSGCGSALSAAITGGASEFPDLSLNAENVLSMMHQFQMDSVLFKQTGGVHSAGLIKNDKMIYFAEDIGRHNAVDKVAGMALQKSDDLSEFYLICSGRISSEIVKKCVRLGIPLIISQSAPTSEAIRLGWNYKLYIIGFARGKRFNIYSGFETLQFR